MPGDGIKAAEDRPYTVAIGQAEPEQRSEVRKQHRERRTERCDDRQMHGFRIFVSHLNRCVLVTRAELQWKGGSARPDSVRAGFIRPRLADSAAN